MDEYEQDSSSQGLLPEGWTAGDWKEVARYYRDLLIKAVDDLVDAEEENSELQALLGDDGK